MAKTLNALKKSITNEVSDYVEVTICEWYSQYPDVGEPKFTMGMTDALLDGLFIAHDVADRLDQETSHRQDVVVAVLHTLWNRYIGLPIVEHDGAWNSLRDLVDGTYEMLYGNVIADLF